MRFPSLLLALAVAATVHPWSAAGHMVVSAIAEEDLKPEVRAEIARLLEINKTERAYDFLTAASWADDTRNAQNGRWHYINFHFKDDDKAVVTMMAEDENVVTAIAKFSRVLADRSQSDVARADALRFVMHFVGDVHVPVHSVARDTEQFPQGDRGGNDFKIVPPRSMQADWRRPPDNLHSLWDSGCALLRPIDRPLTPENETYIRENAEQIMKEFPRSRLVLRTFEPTMWALENVPDAQKVVYNLKEGTEPSERYMAQGRRLSKKRLAMAGYRLADLLNHLLAPSRPN